MELRKFLEHQGSIPWGEQLNDFQIHTHRE
jgi:hypothetical protein